MGGLAFLSQDLPAAYWFCCTEYVCSHFWHTTFLIPNERTSKMCIDCFHTQSLQHNQTSQAGLNVHWTSLCMWYIQSGSTMHTQIQKYCVHSSVLATDLLWEHARWPSLLQLVTVWAMFWAPWQLWHSHNSAIIHHDTLCASTSLPSMYWICFTTALDCYTLYRPNSLLSW